MNFSYRTIIENRASSLLYKIAISLQPKNGVVILPANVCPVVPLTLAYASVNFEFIDVSEQTMCLDIDSVVSRMREPSKPQVAAIIYVRTYGFIQDMSTEFEALKTKYSNVLIIDDRCLAKPILDKNQCNKQNTDIVLYSTGYSKYVDLDFGGFGHIRNDINIQKIEEPYSATNLDSIDQIYKNSIKSGKTLTEYTGKSLSQIFSQYSDWLDLRPLQMTHSRYWDLFHEKIEEIDLKKSKINSIYQEGIIQDVQLPANYHDWRFQILVNNKTELLKKIFSEGLFASGHYYPSSKLFSNRSFLVSENIYQKIINLFNDHYISEEQAQNLVILINQHLADNK